MLCGRWRNAQRCCDRAIAYLDDDQCQDIAWELNTARTFALWALQYQGNLQELARRQPELLRMAEETKDHFAILNFRTQVMTHLLTAADRPEAALASLNSDRQLLSDRGFFVQHHNQTLARTYLQIYLGDGRSAFEEIDGTWQKYRAAFLSQVQQVRIDHFQVRTRAALAAATASPRNRHAMLKVASQGIHRLRRERTPWASALATALSAAHAQLAGDSRTAIERLLTAERAFDRVRMQLFANAVRHHHSKLAGGDDVRRGEIAAQWQQMQVVAPDRMANMLVPGFNQEHGAEG